MKPSQLLIACAVLLSLTSVTGCTKDTSTEDDHTSDTADNNVDGDTDTESLHTQDTDTSEQIAKTRLDASQSHPSPQSGVDIPIDSVPMFIVLGFDDNGITDAANNGGSTWILNYLDGKTNSDDTPVHASFYMTGKYGAEWVYESPTNVLQSWRDLEAAGHEIGVHSMDHLMWWTSETDNGTYDGRSYTLEEWAEKEFNPVIDVLTAEFPDGAGFSRDALRSWRTPRLEWNNALLSLLSQEGILYDCSIESSAGTDAQSEYWPFTLDDGCPWDDTVTSHPGLWELPAYRFHIPPTLVDKAGVTSVTGLDYNVWIKKDWGGLELSGPDFTSILRYNLDERMAGNRAPLLIGLHSDIYTDLHGKNDEYIGTENARERQLAIEDFVDYALSTYPDVRFVSGIELVAWLTNPEPLE